MEKTFSYSIRLHFAAICCFLLPFFYTGCEKKSESASTDTTAVDSTSQSIDTTSQVESTSLDTISSTIDTAAVDTITNSDSTSKPVKFIDDPSLYISKKLPFLSLILVSKPETYSGIAVIVNSIPWVFFYATIGSMVFLIFGLLIKYVESHARKTILMMDIVALVSLVISRPASINCEVLWGYWVALIVVFSLAVLDVYILRLIIKQNKK